MDATPAHTLNTFPINKMVWFRNNYRNDPAFRRLFIIPEVINKNPKIASKEGNDRLVVEVTTMWNHYKQYPGYDVFSLIETAYQNDKAEYELQKYTGGKVLGNFSDRIPVIEVKEDKPADSFARQLRNGKWSDITIKINGIEIHSHKDILAKCGFFKAALCDNFKPETEFEIIGASGPAPSEHIDFILDQLYNIKNEFVPKGWAFIAELYSIAKFLDFTDLIDELHSLLDYKISTDAQFDIKKPISTLVHMNIFSREQALFLQDDMPKVYYLSICSDENYFPSELSWLWHLKYACEQITKVHETDKDDEIAAVLAMI